MTRSCDWVLVIWDVNRSGVCNVCFLPLKWLGVYSFLSLSFFHRPELEHGHVSQLGLYWWGHHGDRRATRWKEPGNLCDCQELRTPHTGQPTTFHTVMWKRNKPSTCLAWTPARFGLCKGASSVVQMVKNLPTVQETQVRALVRKMPWRRKSLPTPMFLPGKSHGQRSLAGYDPKSHITKSWMWLTVSFRAA